MSTGEIWKPPRPAIGSNFDGLLDRLVAQHGLADPDAAGFPAFLENRGNTVVMLADTPDSAPESWDLAVIFPELLAALGGGLCAAVARPEPARVLQARFGIGRLPALLFLRDGAYVGAIEGLRDWSDFVAECGALLNKPVSRAPLVGIAVVPAGSSGCH